MVDVVVNAIFANVHVPIPTIRFPVADPHLLTTVPI